MARTASTKRRTGATRGGDRSTKLLLALLLMFALLFWGGLLWFTYYIYPSTTSTYFVFFLLLLNALTLTLAPPIYGLGARFFFARSNRMTPLRALLLSLVCALAVVLNLILRALHSWNPIMAIVIVAAAFVVEILFLARKA
jgi:hypothetical protein